MRFIARIVFLIVLVSSCQNSEKKSSVTEDKETKPKLGSVKFDVSGSPEAIPLFENGLLYLHSFEYLDAKSSFIEAQKKDPSFGMAYWGELMAYNHSLWHRQLYDEAQATLSRMGKTPAKRLELLKTQLEKDLFSAVEILYGQGSKNDRDQAYSDYMAKLYNKYPGNHEVATFYAVSLLGVASSTRDVKVYDKSAKILSTILDENPKHPGALHYFIHSRDYPSHAHLAIEAAESYSKIAPDAAHALHMPSHIFIALGRWNDVITANIDSWNASVKKHLSQPVKPASYHALAWLHYGMLQRKEYDTATKLLEKMYTYCQKGATQSARTYLMSMKGAHMVETGIWDGPIPNIPVKIEDLNISHKTGFFYIEAMKGFYHKKPDYISSILKKVKNDKYLASLNLGKDVVLMCNALGAGSRPATQKDIDMVTIMEMQIEAKLELLNGNKTKYLALLKEAATLEDDISYDFGPPVVFKPINEEYAEALIEEKQYKAAIAQFDKALKKHPRRLLSLQGKLNASQQLGDAKLVNLLQEDIDVSLTPKARLEIL